MKKIRITTTIELTDEQYDACVKLARMLGLDEEASSEHQLVKRLLVNAAHNEAYYAEEQLT